MSEQRGPPRRERQPREIGVYEVEQKAVVLDVIEGGYYLDPHKGHRSRTTVQAIGFSRFTLLDGVPVGRVEPLEQVSVASETLMPVEEPLDPTGRRTRRIDVSLACIPLDGKMLCAPIVKVEQRILDLLKLTLEEGVEVVSDTSQLSEVLRSRGLPDKIIACPRTGIRYEHLTEIAKRNVRDAIKMIIKEDEGTFVRFFNIAGPINIRMHSFELLRGIGKKTLKMLLDARAKKPFESFDEIKKIIKEDPVEVLADKIIEELSGQAKYYLFVEPQNPSMPYLKYLDVLRSGKAGAQA